MSRSSRDEPLALDPSLPRSLRTSPHGWQIKRTTGSHRVLQRAGWADVVFAFHDHEEIGPRMLARLAKVTGLTPEDLQEVSVSRRAAGHV